MAKFIAVLSFLSFFISAFATSLSPIVKRDDVVQFSIVLTWGDVNPTGGIGRKAVLINGTFPGPPLLLNLGQVVEFTVYNELPVNSTIHFHGIRQQATPYSDGTPGLTQWSIKPGQAFLYRWIADEPGSYWYHAHDKGQMVDGAYGAIFIAAPPSAPRPFSLISNDTAEQSKMLTAEAKNQAVFISDWSQYTFEEFYALQEASNVDNSCADSIVVNGQGSVYCLSRNDINAFTNPIVKPLLAMVSPSQMTDKGCLPPNLIPVQGHFPQNLTALPDAAYYTCTPSTGSNATFEADPAAGYIALTFINSGSFTSFKVTVDSHKMWVYEVSGYYNVPQLVDEIVVSGGDRYVVMIKLDQPVGTYTIRVATNGLNQILSGFAELKYIGSTGPATTATSVMNYAGYNTTTITTFIDTIAAPFPPLPPIPTADVSFVFDIKKITTNYMWTQTGSLAYPITSDQQLPLLFQDPSTIPDSELIKRTKANQWVDLIVIVSGPVAEPHPMHKHGNKMYLIGLGDGPFNYSSVAQAAAAMPAGTFNFNNPPYRDGFSTVPATGTDSWMVLRYHADDPGAWLFHCHMQTHLTGGMASVILDATDKWPVVPGVYLNGSNGFETGAAAGMGAGTIKQGCNLTASLFPNCTCHGGNSSTSTPASANGTGVSSGNSSMGSAAPSSPIAPLRSGASSVTRSMLGSLLLGVLLLAASFCF